MGGISSEKIPSIQPLNHNISGQATAGLLLQEKINKTKKWKIDNIYLVDYKIENNCIHHYFTFNMTTRIKTTMY